MARDYGSGVQSVVRAVSLLNILADCPTDCSLSELTRQARLPSSTVHRLLTSLMLVGYVSQNPETARYGLGNNLIRLGQRAAKKHDLIKVARPWLEQLADATGETVNLTARLGDSVIQLDHVDSPNMLRVSYPSGEQFPLHASASGKLFLAYLPKDEYARFMAKTRLSFTPATLVRREELEEETKRIRSLGYAIDDAEREMGVRCVAVPIRVGRGEVVAAISISGPSLRITVAQLHELADSLIQTAQSITDAWNVPYVSAAAKTP